MTILRVLEKEIFFFFSVCAVCLPSWPRIGYGALHFGHWEYHIKVTGFEPKALWIFLPSWPRIGYGALHFGPWEYHVKVTGFEHMALWNFFISYLGASFLKELWRQMTYLTTVDNMPTFVGLYVLKLIVCKQKHVLFSMKLLLLFIQ